MGPQEHAATPAAQTWDNAPKTQSAHPNYYTAPNGMQAWDLIEAFGIGYNLGCAIKYISRAGKKTPDPTTDLKKAIRMIERELECYAKRVAGGAK